MVNFTEFALTAFAAVAKPCSDLLGHQNKVVRRFWKCPALHERLLTSRKQLLMQCMSCMFDTSCGKLSKTRSKFSSCLSKKSLVTIHEIWDIMWCEISCDMRYHMIWDIMKYEIWDIVWYEISCERNTALQTSTTAVWNRSTAVIMFPWSSIGPPTLYEGPPAGWPTPPPTCGGHSRLVSVSLFVCLAKKNRRFVTR